MYRVIGEGQGRINISDVPHLVLPRRIQKDVVDVTALVLPLLVHPRGVHDIPRVYQVLPRHLVVHGRDVKVKVTDRENLLGSVCD